MNSKLTTSGIISMLFCAMVWGSLSIATKVAVEITDVSTFNVYRFLFVLPFLLFVKKPAISWMKLVLISLTWSGLNFFFLGLAIKLGLPPGTCMFIFQTNTLFAIAFSFLFLQEKVPLNSIVSMVIGFIGLYLLLSNKVDNQFSWLGFGCALLSALVWALGFLCVKTSECKDKAALNIWASLFSFLFFLLFEVLTNGTSKMLAVLQGSQEPVIIAAFYAGIIGSVMANSLWYRLVGKYTASALMPFMIFVPVTTLVMSIAFFGEELSLQKVSACLLILLALFINHYGTRILSIESLRKKI